MKSNFAFVVLLATIFSSCTSTYYYVVRHAEKEIAGSNATMMTTDPPLSEAGKVRAIVLRDELKNKHITRIFSTNTIRTISTANPLSEQSGVPVTIYNTKDSLDYFIDGIKNSPRGNILIVGHSNTVDDVVNKLCNESKIASDLPDGEYDNLFIVKLKGKKAKLIRKKYGYPSNPEK
jgi:broad specificity phosphatase PhoE